MSYREYLEPNPAFTDYNAGYYPRVNLKYADKIKAKEALIVNHRGKYRLRFMKLKRAQLSDPGFKFWAAMRKHFRLNHRLAAMKALSYFQKRSMSHRNLQIREHLLEVIKLEHVKDTYTAVFKNIVERLTKLNSYGQSSFMYTGYKDLEMNPYPQTGRSFYYTKKDEETGMPVVYAGYESLEEQGYKVEADFEKKEDDLEAKLQKALA